MAAHALRSHHICPTSTAGSVVVNRGGWRFVPQVGAGVLGLLLRTLKVGGMGWGGVMVGAGMGCLRRCVGGTEGRWGWVGVGAGGGEERRVVPGCGVWGQVLELHTMRAPAEGAEGMVGRGEGTPGTAGRAGQPPAQLSRLAWQWHSWYVARVRLGRVG